MWTNKPLKTVEKMIKRHADKIDEYHIEDDEGGEVHEGPFSYWIYFKPFWINRMTETHIIHESTARAVIEMFGNIEPCDCKDCHETAAYKGIGAYDPTR